MRTMNYSETRRTFAETMDWVTANREEVVITRSGGKKPVVMVDLDDYEALQETAYLLRSPENARRLLDSIAELESGGGTRHDLTRD